jgi:hypothetical protein
MTRGKIVEAEAAQWYEFDQDQETTPIGFVASDTFIADARGCEWRSYGCSPDRLVGDDGLLEIKCPIPSVQMRYFLEQAADIDHKPQLQGQLMIAERKWLDILCWHPEMAKVVIRVERDEPFIDLLRAYLSEVNEYMNGVMESIALHQMPASPAKTSVREMLHKSLNQGHGAPEPPGSIPPASDPQRSADPLCDAAAPEANPIDHEHAWIESNVLDGDTRLPYARCKCGAIRGQAKGPIREWPIHKAWIESQPCMIRTFECFPKADCQGDIVSAHIRTAANSGTGLKPPQWDTVPLCTHHHGLQHQKGQPEFARLCGLNLLPVAQGYAERSPDEAMKKEMRKWIK